MRPKILHRTDPSYPFKLSSLLGKRAPVCLFALGRIELLRGELLGLFCSVRCPGGLIIKTFDLARDLRDAGVPVIGGFHSPMERECLSLLLKGKQPVVWCLAKRLNVKGFPKECVQPIEEGRLLALSPFEARVKRSTLETASFRNEVVAALADQILVTYAAPGGKTEAFCRKVLEWRKPLFTFDDPETATLRSIGAQPIRSAKTIWATSGLS